MHRRKIYVIISLVVLFSLLVPTSTNPIKELNDQIDSATFNKIEPILQEQMGLADEDDTLNIVVATKSTCDPILLSTLELEVGWLDVRRIFTICPGFEAQATASQIFSLAAESEILSIEWGDYLGELCMYTAQYYSNTDDLRKSSGYDVTGSGITVAVLDSGVWTDHNDLNDGQLIAFKDIVGNGYYDDFSPPITGCDFVGHGTAMAGIIAGSGDSNPYLVGLAPDASLVAVRICDYTNMPTYSDCVAALDWVGEYHDDYGIDIVSCSWGFSKVLYYYGETGDILSRKADALYTEHGVIVVAATGNSGDSRIVKSPSISKYSICVGGVADPSEGGWCKYDGTQRGPADFYDIPGNPDWYKPDILAPGVNILCPSIISSNGYEEVTGTSPAAAFVSGLIALYLDYDADLANDNDYDGNPDVKQLLWASAKDVPGDSIPGIDGYYGAGRVDGMAGLDFYTSDISSTRYNAKIVSGFYMKGDEPMWRLDSISCEDWYRFTATTSCQIEVIIQCDPDLMVEVRLYKNYLKVKQDTSISRGDDCYISYSGYASTYYVRVKLTGDYTAKGYPGDYYDIIITVNS